MIGMTTSLQIGSRFVNCSAVEQIESEMRYVMRAMSLNVLVGKCILLVLLRSKADSWEFFQCLLDDHNMVGWTRVGGSRTLILELSVYVSGPTDHDLALVVDAANSLTAIRLPACV